MNYFIIGDVHGCFYTLLNILTNRRNTDYLIFVGDYIDRGLFPHKTIQLLEEIIDSHNGTLVMGNHDYYYSKFISGIPSIQEAFLKNDFELTRFILDQNGIFDQDMHRFISKLHFVFDRKNFSVSHAGISLDVKAKLTEYPEIINSSYFTIKENLNSIYGYGKYKFLHENLILNRELPDNIGKLQIHGHTPLMCCNPVFYPKINCWNLDTGAFLGWGMSAIRIDEEGKMLDNYFVETDLRDVY